MKHFTFSFNDKKNYKKALKQSKKENYKSQLIQLFTSKTNKQDIQKILNKLKKDFKDAIIIGSTTAGEISHAKMYDDETIVSLSLFKHTKLKVAYSKNITNKSGKKLSKTISTKYTKASIVLSEGLLGEDYEGFISGIKEQNKKLIIAGGLAGDNFLLKQTFVFLGTDIYSQGAVGVSFSGKKLYANNKYNLNWTPIGKKFTITSSNGNKINTIDNMEAVKFFKKYLGNDIFKNNAATLSDIQLVYTEGKTTVSRTPMTVDNNSIIFAGPLKEGQKVQFGFSNASSVISGASNINKEITQNPAQAIYIFSCIARKTLLGKVLENEFSFFENIAPTSGFFTYGEFYSTTKNNALLNCTTTILVLSESSKKIKQNTKQIKIAKNITFNALTHFIKQTSTELDLNTKLLNQYKIAVDESSIVSKADKHGTITYVNENFCKVSKYSKEELLGKNHNIIRNENISSFIFKKMWSTITNKKVWKGTLSNRAKDGSIYYVNATILPLLDKDNNIEEFIAIRQDITKQVLAKKKMREKEKLIKAIFDNQDSIVIYASKTKGMLNVNKKLFEYLDYKNFEEFKNNNQCICDKFIDEDGYVTKSENWMDDIADDTHKQHKVKMKTKDGQIRTFNLSVNRIDNEYIINLSDITSLEVAVLKANSSEQAKSLFLANMSHEIRTPLNGILGFTDILSKKDLDKDAKRYVEIINTSGQTLLHVVNDILDFSKIESGKLSIFESEADILKEMEATISTFASISKNKKIDYYTFIDPNLPKLVKCDIQRLKQVINNLVSNAIKFTPDDGEVMVQISLQKVQNNKATIFFSVKDSGIGIAPQKLKNIFQPFSQADNSISRKFGGTGLGLAISSQYIEKMGSKLQVTSVENKGSEFYFDLEVEILDKINKFNKIDIANINIAILKSNGIISCGINEILSTYLKSWGCSFMEVDTLLEIDKNTDVLIVCAKLFDKNSCQDVLDNFTNLQLLYIEGGEENFNCSHPKFHLIEQPMTGSALFDNLITITSNKELTYTNQQEEVSINSYDGNVLVAEDNETNQMLIAIMLEERNINYTIVPNGQEAIQKATQEDFDLILMDINMPILDGISATKQLREQNYNKPIVSLSANVIQTDIDSFKEAGVDDTLNKPIVPNELDKVLTNYLHKIDTDFDTVDIQLLCEELAIPNEEIIFKLLESFLQTATEMIITLKSQKMDEYLLHTIKGVCANLRFNKLYEIVSQYEQELLTYTDEEHQKNKQILITHLEKLILEVKRLSV